MRVDTNSAALAASIALDANSQVVEKLAEHLSSGRRLNSAADDPSGLAISENMLAQSNGSNQAVHNLQDTVSLLQTAEGGMQSIVDSMQRIRVLALQSANDTYTDAQRQGMQVEVDQLKQHIDQVAKQTDFNGLKLLDGTFDLTSVPASFKTGNFLQDANLDFASGFQGMYIAVSSPDSPNPATFDLSQTVQSLGLFADTNASVLQNISDGINASGLGITSVVLADATGTAHAIQTSASNGNGSTYVFVDQLDAFGNQGTLAQVGGLNNQTLQNQGQYFVVQAGPNADQTVPLTIPNMTLASLGLGGVDISSAQNAQNAIGTIDNSMFTVAGDQAVIGAGENRLIQGQANQQNQGQQALTTYSGIVDTNVAADASSWKNAQAIVQMSEAVLTKAVQTASNLSAFTVAGLRQRFPLAGAGLGG